MAGHQVWEQPRLTLTGAVQTVRQRQARCILTLGAVPATQRCSVLVAAVAGCRVPVTRGWESSPGARLALLAESLGLLGDWCLPGAVRDVLFSFFLCQG